MESPRGEAPLLLRKPREEDASSIWRLIKSTERLDLNSPYCYMLLGKYFADTCVVAEKGGEVVAFVSAFIPPQLEHTLFVWQVAVSPAERGRGLGKELLYTLLRREPCSGVRFLQATVTPANAASAALFRGLARELGAECNTAKGFSASSFPGTGHEEEVLFQIGPFCLD